MTHQFSCFRGVLSESKARKIQRAIQKTDAKLVTYTDPQCSCGFGCRPFSCPRSERGWFETEDLGSPFNEATAREVAAALARAGIKLPR